jgi:hypothetical protein
MNRKCRLTISLLLLVLYSLTLTSVMVRAAQTTYQTKHVIVAVMDGVRYSETFGDPQHKYVAKMWQQLIPQGVLYTSYYNWGVTVTRQGHSTIASGTWQVIDNGGPRLTMPTFFDYYREESGAPAEKAWAIFGKGAYSFAPYSSFPVYRDRWGPKSEIGIGENSLADDQKVLEKIQAVMKTDRPNLIYANFGYTDHSAHVEPFEAYAKAVVNVDEIFVKLWQAIQSDPEYRDSTTLILTNDHGRHDDAHGGYQSHGDGCDGCRHVFLLMLGPDFKKNTIINQPASLIDINPTVGELLGFQTPLAKGRVLSESFVSYKTINRKEPQSAAAREAVRLQNLAERDLGQTVSSRFLSNSELVKLLPGPDSLLLIRGLISMNTVSGDLVNPVQTTISNRLVRDWLERNETTGGNNIIYKDLVLLESQRPLNRYFEPNNPKYNEALNRALQRLRQLEGSSLSPVEEAFFISLLSRLVALAPRAANQPGPDPILFTRIEKGLQILSAPVIKKLDQRQAALIQYALSDALFFLDEYPKTPVVLKTKFRNRCLLGHYYAIQLQLELGGLWPDPSESLLYLNAARKLELLGLFRGFKSQQQLTLGKKQDEKAVLPEIVLNLEITDIQSWSVSGQTLPKNELLLRERISTYIWERNAYLGFSRDLTRFWVDSDGRLPGEQSVLSGGAFLCLWYYKDQPSVK